MQHTRTLSFFTALLLGTTSICTGQLASVKHLPSTRSADPISTPTAQSRIRGVVEGPKGPLPGAIVQVNGTTALTVSGAEGKFDLVVPTTATTVLVTCSYAGLADVVMKLPANATNAVIQFVRPVQLKTVDPELEEGWW